MVVALHAGPPSSEPHDGGASKSPAGSSARGATLRELPARDGRHARSERTRAAVVEALLALLEEGNLQPSLEIVAERAGVSRRLLFHHFRDREDLFATAAAHRMARVMPLVKPPPLEGSLRHRVATFTSQLCELYEKVAPVRRAALLVEPSSDAVATGLGEARRRHRAAVEAVFAAELAASPREARDELAASLAAAVSFATWNELRAHQGLSAAGAASAIERMVSALLGRTPPRRTEVPRKRATRVGGGAAS